MTRSVGNQSVKPAVRTLACGHMLTFELSPPRIGEIVLCPSCRIDDPPRRVVKAAVNEQQVLGGRKTACLRNHGPGCKCWEGVR